MNPYLRVSLLFGTVAAVMVLVYFLVLQYLVSTNALTEMTSLDILIVLLCMLFAMGYYRDRLQGGMLHFWQGAIIGIETGVIGTLLSCLFIYLIVKWIDPSSFTEFIEIIRKDLLKALQEEHAKSNPTASTIGIIQDRLAILPKASPATTIFFSVTSIFVKNVLIVILVTGMIAAIMRKNVSHFEVRPPSPPKTGA